MADIKVCDECRTEMSGLLPIEVWAYIPNRKRRSATSRPEPIAKLKSEFCSFKCLSIWAGEK